MEEIGADAGDAVGVAKMAVGAVALSVGVDEQDKGSGNTDGQSAQVDEGKRWVFAEVAEDM